MSKIKIILTFIILVGSVIGMCVACKVLHQENADFYNVIYRNNKETIEYYDVTDLHKWEGKITFITCDGATVVLNDGCIEIIPIDVD